MADMTRTQNSIRNSSVLVIASVISILGGYFVRVAFTHIFPDSIVGINGLFVDIIGILSLADMGFGTAIAYALYEPIATGNIEKQKSLMRLFRSFYRIVAAVVTVAGLVIMLFLPIIIKDKGTVEHVYIIYFLFLANSVSSYLLIYKKTIIDAHQLIRISTGYSLGGLLVQYALQLLLLLLYPNFILYLVIAIIVTVGKNYIISYKADKLYPFLKDKDVAPLAEEDKGEITKNVKSMILHKTGNVLIGHTDNIILSAFLGLATVGKYSNYFLLIGSVRQIFDRAFEGLAASVGNVGATESDTMKKNIFELTFLMAAWIFGWTSITLFELLSPFVAISFGENYVFEKHIVLILCVNFLITGIRKPSVIFHDSLGLFWYDRYKPVAETIINIGTSLVFVQFFGTFGVFLGTLVSTVATNVWIEPYVLYKYGFKSSAASYFKRYVYYLGVITLAFFATEYVCAYLLPEGGNVFTLFIRVPVVVIVPNLIFLICFGPTHTFKKLFKTVMGLFKK